MATLNAIYKISADISSLESGMHRAVAATESVEKTATRVGSTLSSMGKAMLGALSVAAISNAVRSFTDLTGKLTDLSAKTGISTTELQKLKYAAELTGGTLEGTTRAIALMARHLVEGDKSAAEAMKRLGLNINEVRQMQPGQAFSTIADAIAKVKSPLEQSTLAMQLFGKSGADILPMIKGNMTEAMEAAQRLGIVLDEDTVAAGDRLGDSFTTLSAVGQGVLGKVLAPLVPAVQIVADAMTGLGGVVTWLQDGFTKLLEWGVRAIKFFVDAAVKIGEFAKRIPILGSNMRDVDKSAIESLKTWSVWFGDMANGMSTTLPKTTKATTSLKTAVGLLTTEQKSGVKATRDHARELERNAEAAERLYRESKAAGEALERMYRDALRSGAAGAFSQSLEKNKQLLEDSVDVTLDWIDLWTKGIPIVNGLGSEWAHVGEEIDIATVKFKEADDGLKGLSQSLANLAQVSGGAFGDVARELATLVTAMHAAKQAGEQMAKGGFMNVLTGGLAGASAIGAATQTGSGAARAGKGALTGFQIGAAFGPWGMAIGAGIGALTGWIRGLNQGRKAIKDFAHDLGGFDSVRLKLSALGDEGERMWKQLTQGVANGDLKSAEQAISSVSEGLARVPERLNEMIAAAVTSGAAIDTALMPMIDDLIRTGQLTQENANLLMGLPAAGVPGFGKVEAAAEALGLDINALGENIKQLGFTESAEQLAANMEILQRAGADMDAVTTGAREKIQAIIDEAMRFGRSLPESMRPFLQNMVDAGKLTDVFGDKLVDLDDLHFTKPLEQSVENLIAAMHELVGVIRDDVGGALDDLSDRVVRPRVEVIYENAGQDTVAQGVPGFAYGTRGQYVDFGRGTLAMLHGRERIMTEGEGSGGSYAITVPVSIDGRVIATAVARVSQRELMNQTRFNQRTGS